MEGTSLFFFQIGVNLFHCKLCQVDNFFVDSFIIPRYLNKLSIENVVSELLRCVLFYIIVIVLDDYLTKI